MDHPLIGNIDDLSLEDLSTRINDLTKKYWIAHRLGNYHLCQQIQLSISTFQNKYQEKIRKNQDDTDFGSIIDIS